jgi:CspA family cold shock protein
VRRPWIVQFGSAEAWIVLRADSPEEIETKYPELRVVHDLPERLTNDPARLESLYANAGDIDDERNPLLNGILAERSAKSPWENPVLGRVKWFNAEKGVGAISCRETAPDDVWVHYSMIEGSGYRALEEGEAVEMEYLPARQDSFNYRALRVRRVRGADTRRVS